MKKNKIFIIIFIVLLVIAIACGVYYAISSYIFNSDNTITDSKSELIEHLKGIENTEERKYHIDTALEYNLITQEDANTLY